MKTANELAEGMARGCAENFAIKVYRKYGGTETMLHGYKEMALESANSLPLVELIELARATKELESAWPSHFKGTIRSNLIKRIKAANDALAKQIPDL